MTKSKEARIIHKLNKVTPVGTEIVLPNNSGDHMRSIKRNTPVNDADLVNKSYVDAHNPFNQDLNTTDNARFKSLGVGVAAPGTTGYVQIGTAGSGRLSIPGSAANTLQLGVGATVTAADSVAIGDSSSATNTRVTCIGYNAQTAYTQSTCIGWSTSVSGSSGTAIGANASCQGNAVAIGASVTSQSGGVAIGRFTTLTGSGVCIGYLSTAYAATAVGYGCSSTGTNSCVFGSLGTATAEATTTIGVNAHCTAAYTIAVGTSANASAANGCALGRSANSTHYSSVALGRSAATTATHQLVIGENSTSYYIDEIKFGRGEILLNRSAANKLQLTASSGIGFNKAPTVTGIDVSGNSQFSGVLDCRDEIQLGTGSTSDQVTINGKTANEFQVDIAGTQHLLVKRLGLNSTQLSTQPNLTLGSASTDIISYTGRMQHRTINDADPDSNVAGSTGEIVFNTNDTKFYGCTSGGVAGSATWAALN